MSIFKKVTLLFILFLVIGIGCFALVDRDNINKDLNTKLEQTEKTYSGRIDSMTKYQEGLCDKISKLQDNVSSLQTSYNNLQETYQAYVDENELKLENLKTELASVKQSLTDLQANSDVDKAKIAELQTKITNLEKSISEKNVTIEQLNSTIETQKATIAELNKTITDLTNDLNSDLSNVEIYKKIIDGTVTEITAEDLKGVTKIRPYAFYYLSTLTSVELSESIISVGTYSFFGCGNLTSISFGQNFKSLSPNSFARCNLISLNLYNTKITEIPFGCFESNKNLTSVTLPKVLETILSSAFKSCAFETIDFPGTLKTVRIDVFSGNSNLKKLIFPNSLETLDLGFSNLSSLNEIFVPTTTNLSIDSYCFSDVDYLESFTTTENTTIDSYIVAGRKTAFKLIFTGQVNLGTYSLASCDGPLTLRFENPNVTIENNFAHNSNIVKIEVPADSVETFKAMPSLSSYADKIVAIEETA